MGRDNQTCISCERSFHYCSSCGYDGYSELGYCSELCLDISDQFGSWKRMIKLLKDVTPEQHKIMMFLLNYISAISRGGYEIERLISDLMTDTERAEVEREKEERARAASESVRQEKYAMYQRLKDEFEPCKKD